MALHELCRSQRRAKIRVVGTDEVQNRFTELSAVGPIAGLPRFPEIRPSAPWPRNASKSRYAWRRLKPENEGQTVPFLIGTGATLLNGGYIHFSHNRYYGKYWRRLLARLTSIDTARTPKFATEPILTLSPVHRHIRLSMVKWSRQANVYAVRPCLIAFQVRVLTAESESELAATINMDGPWIS